MQHDLDIANQAGAAFRADLNIALQAIGTNQSGSAEPSTTYPFQLWADTSFGILWQRNALNNGWVKVGMLGYLGLGLVGPGTIAFHGASTPPPGWLKANGAAVSRTTYSDLFTLGIGTTFGAGDGSTTFNLPDLRGEFVRGWDDSRGVDAGRSFGSAQSDLLRSHTHTATTVGAGVFIGAGSNYAAGATDTGATGGAETRPRNIALLPIIKF